MAILVGHTELCDIVITMDPPISPNYSRFAYCSLRRGLVPAAAN